jgi:hypothetical protein
MCIDYTRRSVVIPKEERKMNGWARGKKPIASSPSVISKNFLPNRILAYAISISKMNDCGFQFGPTDIPVTEHPFTSRVPVETPQGISSALPILEKSLSVTAK